MSRSLGAYAVPSDPFVDSFDAQAKALQVTRAVQDAAPVAFVAVEYPALMGQKKENPGVAGISLSVVEHQDQIAVLRRSLP